MSENLLDFLNEIQKFAIKIKIQETVNSLVKNDRVHDVVNADIIMEYYEKMHKHFDNNPQDFLFTNHDWLNESLERLNIDLLDVFDEDDNPDHIKREEVIALFLILWINMKLQDRDNNHPFIKGPYDLFYLWIYDRVLVIRPTKEFYLQDWDDKVINKTYNKYGWFTGIHVFIINEKGVVEYHYTDPDGITNTNNIYKRKREVSKVYYDIEAIIGSIGELADEILKEKDRLKIIRPRNTKFVVREMSGCSNKEYKQILKDYEENRIKKSSDPYIKEIVDVLANDYGVEVNSDFISYAKKLAKPKEDSRFKSVAIIDIINAMIKLKDKVGDEEDE